MLCGIDMEHAIVSKSLLQSWAFIILTSELVY